jgi:hypothetical protein
MKMFYLSLQSEIDARTQETAINLKQIEKPNYNETIEALRKFQPLRDAKLMIDYNTGKLIQVKPEAINLFVKTFNDNIKLFSDKQNIKTIQNPTEFFKYWSDIINDKGDELFRKIMKMVADKHNVKDENYLIVEMDGSLLYKISGIDFNECHK